MEEDPTQGRADTPQRLFLGIEVPRAAREVVTAGIAPWREGYPSARWVPSENWHVTVKFLGWVPAQLITWLGTTVEGIADSHPRIVTGVQGLGAFPSVRRARVLWAGIVDPVGALAALAIAMDAGLRAEFPPESRPFHPHLTVARSEPPLRLPESYEATSLGPEPFTADRVILFRSRQQGRTTTYEELGSFSLRG